MKVDLVNFDGGLLLAILFVSCMVIDKISNAKALKLYLCIILPLGWSLSIFLSENYDFSDFMRIISFSGVLLFMCRMKLDLFQS